MLGFVPTPRLNIRFRRVEVRATLPGDKEAGPVLLVAGVGVLLAAFARFVREGIGTPAPVAPTQHLVVHGLYRHVRNPMYLAVWAGILGQAILLAQISLVWWLLAVVAATTAFVKGYEEPTLRRQFPDEYDAYVAAVPGWVPRLRPAPGDPPRS